MAGDLSPEDASDPISRYTMHLPVIRNKTIGNFLVLLSIGLNSDLDAGIHVWLPDTSVSQNSLVRIPVYISSVGRADSVIAYDCEFQYDEQYLIFRGVSHENAMTASWGFPYFNSDAGMGTAAAFTSNISSMQISDTTHVWLYLEFRIQSIRPADTQIRLTDFHLYSLNGEIITESLSPGAIHIMINFAPVISLIPEIQVLEDDAIVFSLVPYIQDPNDSFSDLCIQFNPDPHVLLLYDLNGTFNLKPEPDWNGETVIQFQAKDPFGAIALGNIRIRIIPVPDPPGPFHLVYPIDECVIQNTIELIKFEWETSNDADSGDQVKYRLYLSQDSLFQPASTMQFANLNSPVLSLNHLIFDPGKSYFWKVIAEDSQFSRESNRPYSFLLIEPESIQQASLISRFKIYNNVPNPFNQETCIGFYLPASGKADLNIIDATGRQICSLNDRVWPAGMNQIIWNGRDDHGRPVASGIYWMVFRALGKTWVQRMCLLK